MVVLSVDHPVPAERDAPIRPGAAFPHAGIMFRRRGLGGCEIALVFARAAAYDVPGFPAEVGACLPT
jgi:hypothetical protein